MAKTSKYYKKSEWGCLLTPLSFFAFFFVLYCIFTAKSTYNDIVEGNVRIACILVASIFIIIIWFVFFAFSIREDKLIDEISNKERSLQSQKEKYEKENKKMQAECEQQVNYQKRLNATLTNLIKNKTPFREVAALKADFETCVFEKDERYLRYKSHPAVSAANKVKEIRDIYRASLFESKQMLYKYEFLLNVFPELRDSFEDEEALIHIKDQYATLDDYNDNRDRTRDWLTDEEYRKLSVDERNQLALDRYKSRKKSNWEIGIEYELYIGYLLREGEKPFDSRWHVVQFGEKNGVEDLGRDIIADRIGVGGKRIIYVIQCKRWSEQRTVHENAICQLFGTTIEYKIKHRNTMFYDFVPVFITTTELSDMAKEFAKQLGVQVMKIPMGNYPMIKCNINNGEKIYHLPFDQQYHRTEITKEGEFYAMTVKEATDRGFRRAMKHFC